MIRKFEQNDLPIIMSIWLNANKDAHSFIDESYWQNHYAKVSRQIPQTEVLVYEEDSTINGFIGVYDHYIAGIFIERSKRAQGAGTMLLDAVKARKSPLSLRVYEKNISAVRFYQKSGFRIVEKSVDEDCGEIEYLMAWEGQSEMSGKTPPGIVPD